MVEMNREILDQIISNALDEDCGIGDLTTESIVPPDLIAQGEFLAKEDLVLAGWPVADKHVEGQHSQRNRRSDRKILKQYMTAGSLSVGHGSRGALGRSRHRIQVDGTHGAGLQGKGAFAADLIHPGPAGEAGLESTVRDKRRVSL